jgi:hypothetical protein
LEALSQISQQDQHATELNHAEKVFGVPFPAAVATANVLQPGEQSLHCWKYR